ncbi:GroES-like protein [Cadophora sp. DSE1049]|nr:GroES-like protein [Cadophora sp. DSE1049]
MKEAIVHSGPKVTIVDSPIPIPNADQVLIKVVYSGTNPKDWKVPEWVPDNPHNSGDDIAGFVEAVGDNVTEFKKGDRVAAFHQTMAPHGSFAEFAIAWSHSTFHLPLNTSFESGATIPLAAMAAALGLYHKLGLPQPWQPATKPTPLIIYGASSALGAFAIKMAQASDIHPIIAVAGKGRDFVEGLISRDRGDTIVDYRNEDDNVISAIQGALKNAGVKEVKHAFDGVSEHGSYQNLSRVLAPQGGKILVVLPGDYKEIPMHIEWNVMMVGSVHGALSYGPETPSDKEVQAYKDFGFVYFRWFSQRLLEGSFTGHPYEIIPGGLQGIEQGLKNLKEGKASAVKYIYKIEDTQ